MENIKKQGQYRNTTNYQSIGTLRTSKGCPSVTPAKLTSKLIDSNEMNTSFKIEASNCNHVYTFPTSKHSFTNNYKYGEKILPYLESSSILNLLLKKEGKSLPKCICHCDAKESLHGCDQSEKWILSCIPDFDYGEKEDEYNIYRTFGLAKIHSFVDFSDQDKYVKAIMKDITRTFSNYSIFKFSNVLRRIFNT